MLLENSKKVALIALAENPQALVASREACRLIGLGYAVAKGWATYKGDAVFAITDDGRTALAEILEPSD